MYMYRTVATTSGDQSSGDALHKPSKSSVSVSAHYTTNNVHMKRRHPISVTSNEDCKRVLEMGLHGRDTHSPGVIM